MKRGDIVWVRLHSQPLKWCPALVLSSHNLRLQVTFSFSTAAAACFVDSDAVVPFEEAFPLISPNNTHVPLLHSALRFLGRTVISALRCPCLTARAQAQAQRTYKFDPVGVLRFVLDAAVSPWVEPACFAHAVVVVAQVHSFRTCRSIHHSKMYKQTANTRTNVKLLSSSSLDQKMHPVTQESVALEPKEKSKSIAKDGEKNVSPTNTYFADSEVVPFEEAFPTLISHHKGDAPVLHSALGFLGQSVVSGLCCPCLTGRAQAQTKWSCEFDPVGVLAFISGAAVSSWVEPALLAHAVVVAAQVHAFRSYCSMKHKKIYKEAENMGNNVKLLPSSSLDQKMHSVTQESVALEPKEKCQITTKNGEKNVAIGAIKRLNSTVPVWEGNSPHLFENKHLIISENFMHSPALDPVKMVRESLKHAKLSFLGFKSISDQSIVDICIENVSTTSKTHISVPSNIMTHLRNCIKKRKNNSLEHCWRLPEQTIIYLNRKRRRLDKSASCYVFPQIGGVQESERDVDISKHTRPRVSHIKMLGLEGSIQKDHPDSTCICETNMNFNDEVQVEDSKGSLNCESLRKLVHCFRSEKCEVDASAAKVQGMLGSDSFVYQERLQMSCNRDKKPLKLKRSAGYISKHTRPRISDIKILEAEGSIKKNHQVSTCKSLSNIVLRIHSDKYEVNASAAKVKSMLGSDPSVYQERLQMSCNRDTTPLKWKRSAGYISKHTIPRISDIKILEAEGSIQKNHQASTCKSLSNIMLRIHSDKYEGDASAEKVKGMLGSDSSLYQERYQISCNMATPPKLTRSARTELSSGDCLVEEGKDCYRGFASCSIFNSKVGQPSKTHVSFPYKSLNMKFPKNFNLPSKEQLVKKFSEFGSVDSSRTRVFSYCGSAHVVFLEEADTFAAYEIAKKKALFGKADVRIWLDPFQYERRGFKRSGHVPPSASNQTEPPLKSCLKNSNSLRKEKIKKHGRVRFTIET